MFRFDPDSRDHSSIVEGLRCQFRLDGDVLQVSPLVILDDEASLKGETGVIRVWFQETTCFPWVDILQFRIVYLDVKIDYSPGSK